VLEYLKVGFRTQRLKNVAPGCEVDEGFQLIGSSNSLDTHCASIIDCSCAVIIADIEGMGSKGEPELCNDDSCVNLSLHL